MGGRRAAKRSPLVAGDFDSFDAQRTTAPSSSLPDSEMGREESVGAANPKAGENRQRHRARQWQRLDPAPELAIPLRPGPTDGKLDVAKQA